MHIVLIQSPLSDTEIGSLIQEFPRYLFVAPSEKEYRSLQDAFWEQVEILYGTRLVEKDLERAPRLRWIHCPQSNLNALCLDQIEKRENILLTRSKEENNRQIGEYVIGAVLAFAKNLFGWYDARQNPHTVWDHKLRNTLLTLNRRVFLQIGLDTVGGEIARQASFFGMRVWGVDVKRTFHPHCEKVFPLEELGRILPDADLISVALPREKQALLSLGEGEFRAMKPGVILSVVGEYSMIDEQALVAAAATGEKFRGIILDASYQRPIPPSSKLWTLPNVLITPDVSPRPRISEKEALNLFRHNLRQYQHENFYDMKNMVGSKKLFFT